MPVPRSRLWWSRRRRLLRSPVVRRSGLAALLVATAVSVAGVQSRAEAAREGWGTERDIAVATARIETGEPIGRGQVAVRRWPEALVPDGALDAVPEGRRAAATIEAGEPLVAARVAPEGLTGLAATVPPGWRAMAVSVDGSGLALEPGDRVDVLATFGPDDTTTVAGDARVIAVDEAAVTVAVPDDRVEAMAEALAAAVVTFALRGAD